MASATQDGEQLDPEVALWAHRMTLLIYLTTAVSGGVLAAGFIVESQWIYAAICICMLGVSVLAEEVPKAQALSAIAFAGLVILAMLGVSHGASAVLALLATTFALAAWDLHDFRRRLTSVDKLPTAREHIARHLGRLGLALGLGLGLGLLGIWVQIDSSTGIVAGLIVLAAIGLTGAVSYLRRASD